METETLWQKVSRCISSACILWFKSSSLNEGSAIMYINDFGKDSGTLS